ncbi:hypothetical protein [Microbacterium sp. ZW T5_56]|uniref:hypothetical protein n=1 Tax=Microbacterium sp. ZW T5_56 TaxID=3378081 RepID=UPI0038552AED
MSSPSDQPDPFQQPDPDVRPPDAVTPPGPPPPPAYPQQQYPPQQYPPQGNPPPGYPPQGYAPQQGVPAPGSYVPPAAGPNPYIQNTPFTPQYGPQKSSITTGGVFIGVGISVLVIIIAFLIHDIPGGSGPIRLVVTGILPIVGCLLTIGRATRSIGLGMVIIGGGFWVTLIGPCFALFMP